MLVNVSNSLLMLTLFQNEGMLFHEKITNSSFYLQPGMLADNEQDHPGYPDNRFSSLKPRLKNRDY